MSKTLAIPIECLQLVLRPVARFCLRRGFAMQDLVAAAKIAFIHVAAEEIEANDKKVNVSRLSAMTGIYRREVDKLYKRKEEPTKRCDSILARVVSTWSMNKRYTNKKGGPRTLTFKGPKSEFSGLVESISKSINPGTILFELERAGIAQRSARGLKLLRQESRIAHDVVKAFRVLSWDMNTLIETIQRNVEAEPGESEHHIHTEYDNVYVSEIPRIRKWLREEGKDFHRRAREFISSFDKDIQRREESAESGGKVALTSFAFSTPIHPDVDEKAR